MKLIVEIYSGARKIIVIVVLNCYVIKKHENISRQGKLKSAIQIEHIIQRSNTDISQFGLAHTLMCSARSFGFLILWRLFLKPTHLNNKIEAQADQWYCSSPSSVTASVPATPLSRSFPYPFTGLCYCVRRTTRTFAPRKNNEKFEVLQMKGTVVNRQNHDSNIPSNIS